MSFFYIAKKQFFIQHGSNPEVSVKIYGLSFDLENKIKKQVYNLQ